MVTYSSRKEQRKPLKMLTDNINRITILQDLLPLFSNSNPPQITIMNEWLLGTNVELTNYPISPSQGWEVVKLIYASSNYTDT
jgi:hypothetical protein